MDIDFLHKCALEDRTEQHQFYDQQDVCKVTLTRDRSDTVTDQSASAQRVSFQDINALINLFNIFFSGFFEQKVQKSIYMKYFVTF